MTLTTFQTTINPYPALGVAGDKATLNPCVYTESNPLADGAVTVGTFVWSTANGAANKGTGAPIGIVERVQAYYNYTVTVGATMVILKGNSLTVVRKGDLYVTTLTAATVGQKVFAVLADGTIKTGASGSTVSGAIETDWYVMTAGAVGDLIVISNWSSTVVTTGA